MPASAGLRRAWGWHRLVEPWAARIVARAGIRPGDLVLDIGAGHGALTAHLVQAGARVLAIELHPKRVAELRQRFAGQPVTVVHADAAALQLPHRPFRVVANPPFALSSELLRTLLSPHSKLVTANLVLQRSFARRCAETWNGRRWQVAAGMVLPRRAFHPPPQVDSAVLLIRRPRGGHGHVVTYLQHPQLPDDIRRAVEGQRNGWQRLQRFQQMMAYPSINSAAIEMDLHTQNLTLQIQRLEADIGTQLLQRAPHRYAPMGLTNRGRRLLTDLHQPEVRALLNRYASANERPKCGPYKTKPGPFASRQA